MQRHSLPVSLTRKIRPSLVRMTLPSSRMPEERTFLLQLPVFQFWFNLYTSSSHNSIKIQEVHFLLVSPNL